MKKLDIDEALRLLLKEELTDEIKDHCRASARAAHVISQALTDAGYDIDAELCVAGAFVHDIKRLDDNHDVFGAAYLESLGYSDAADVVRTHMGRELDTGGRLSENEVVFLSDKVAVGGRIATLEERFNAAMKKYGTTEEIRKAIASKRREGQIIEKKIKEITGRTLEDILKEIAE